MDVKCIRPFDALVRRVGVRGVHEEAVCECPGDSAGPRRAKGRNSPESRTDDESDGKEVEQDHAQDGLEGLEKGVLGVEGAPEDGGDCWSARSLPR